MRLYRSSVFFGCSWSSVAAIRESLSENRDPGNPAPEPRSRWFPRFCFRFRDSVIRVVLVSHPRDLFRIRIAPGGSCAAISTRDGRFDISIVGPSGTGSSSRPPPSQAICSQMRRTVKRLPLRDLQLDHGIEVACEPTTGAKGYLLSGHEARSRGGCQRELRHASFVSQTEGSDQRKSHDPRSISPR